MQSILQDNQRAAKLLRGGDGAYADAWIGHRSIHPAKGKREIGHTECTKNSLAGSVLHTTTPDTDFGKPGRRIIEPNLSAGHSHHDSVHALYAGTVKSDDWKGKSKRHFSTVPRKHPPGATLRQDMHDILHGEAVTSAEASSNKLRWAEDIPVTSKKHLPAPGAHHPSSGGLHHIST
jgi:hypothetical protein